MASLVIGGTFNAIMFAGAGFLFSKLNRAGYEKEIKRHDNALEDLTKAKEKWYENEIGKKDRIQELRQEISDANHDINDTNKALDELGFKEGIDGVVSGEDVFKGARIKRLLQTK